MLRTSAISVVQLQGIALWVPTADHERAAIVFILLEVVCHHNAVAIQALQGMSYQGLIDSMIRGNSGHPDTIKVSRHKKADRILELHGYLPFYLTEKSSTTRRDWKDARA